MSRENSSLFAGGKPQQSHRVSRAGACKMVAFRAPGGGSQAPIGAGEGFQADSGGCVPDADYLHGNSAATVLARSGDQATAVGTPLHRAWLASVEQDAGGRVAQYIVKRHGVVPVGG